jgi:hypothetical protein
MRTEKQQRYVLGRKVDNFTSCSIVLFREREEGRDAYKERTNCVNTGKYGLSLCSTDRFPNQSRQQSKRV